MAALQPTPPRRPGPNWARILIVGTLGACLVLGGLAVLGSVAKGWNTGSAFGVPKDFPIYPNAAMIGVNETFASSGTSVNASWDAGDPLDPVSAFYTTRLNQQPWTVTHVNSVDGTWTFQRTDGTVTGLIRLSGHGQRTRIDILLRK